jgi:hypothetical protein
MHEFVMTSTETFFSEHSAKRWIKLRERKLKTKALWRRWSIERSMKLGPM